MHTHHRGVPLVLLALAAVAPSQEAPTQGPDFGRLPLSFTQNRGQFEAPVRFAAELPAASVALCADHVTCTVKGHPFLVTFVGADTKVQVVGEDEAPLRSHFYLGRDPSAWHTDVRSFAAVRYQNLFAGIDVVYHGNGQRLEYDVVVAPGADPSAAQFRYLGVDRLAVGARGELHVTVAGLELVEEPPVAWQVVGGVQKPVAVAFRHLDPTTFGFLVTGPFDHTLPLVIDPVLSYSSYLGGSLYDFAEDIVVDASGCAYVCGSTMSPNFPATGTAPGNMMVYVAKWNAAGTALLYCVFLGGTMSQQAHGIALSGTNAVVVGTTWANDFPIVPAGTAFDGTFNSTNGSGDAFLLRLSGSGALTYSTYVGGSGADEGMKVAVDPVTPVATLVGTSNSSDYPTSVGCYSPLCSGGDDVVVTRIAMLGNGPLDLVYSTYVGGTNYDRGADLVLEAGNVYVTGHTYSNDFPVTSGVAQGLNDAFVLKLAPNGFGAADLLWSRYLGGNNNDQGQGLALGSGKLVVCGDTGSVNFPTTSGVYQPVYGGGQDGFVTTLVPTTGALVRSTFTGGSSSDTNVDVEVLASGSVLVFGSTNSADFPTTYNAFSTTLQGGDFHVTCYDALLAGPIYSTLFGGSSFESGGAIAVGTNGDWYFCGTGGSLDYPVTTGAFDTTYNGWMCDAMVTKFAQKVPLVFGTSTGVGTTIGISWPTGWPTIGEGSGIVRGSGLLPGGFAILALGYRTATPLPLEALGGLPGSQLYVTPVITPLVFANPAGIADYALPIPYVPGLVGAEFAGQWLAFDVSLPYALPIVHSAALAIEILP